MLVPQSGGDYHGIGLLEPIWKNIECIIDLHLDVIIKAKLSKQLTYLKLQPFYRVFFDLCKAFDAMDQEQCLILLEGYGAGLRMVWHSSSGEL